MEGSGRFIISENLRADRFHCPYGHCQITNYSERQ